MHGLVMIMISGYLLILTLVKLFPNIKSKSILLLFISYLATVIGAILSIFAYPGLHKWS